MVKAIVEFAKEHCFGIVMEDLKGIRRKIRCGRNLNRRSHSGWNFRKLRFFVEYKAKLSWLLVYVNPKEHFFPVPDVLREVWVRRMTETSSRA